MFIRKAVHPAKEILIHISTFMAVSSVLFMTYVVIKKVIFYNVSFLVKGQPCYLTYLKWDFFLILNNLGQGFKITLLPLWGTVATPPPTQYLSSWASTAHLVWAAPLFPTWVLCPPLPPPPVGFAQVALLTSSIVCSVPLPTTGHQLQECQWVPLVICSCSSILLLVEVDL